MNDLYPELNPYNELYIDVDKKHTLYVEQSGNPNGRPVLFIHGGPGAGSTNYHRRYFDPTKYRIILFDQRGCGQSKPRLCLENNTTHDLVEDIEKIRNHLNIEKWMLFGGSWGSTLALVYAQKYPQNVRSMILRGIFLGRKKDIDWFYEYGASEIRPEEFKKFKISKINNLQKYYDVFKSKDEAAKIRYAQSWARWEAKNLTLKVNKDHEDEFINIDKALPLALIETHYFINECWLSGNNAILENVDSIKNIPTTIIHGRHDLICPVSQAIELYECLQNAQLFIAHESAHSGLEPQIISKLIEASIEHLNY